jgi:Bacterial membrane protein YfhO
MAVTVAGSSGAPRVVEEPSETESGTAPPRAHPPWLDVFGILWVIVAAGLALVPTVRHGSYFGTYGVLSGYGLTRSGVIPHSVLSTDQVTEVTPWIMQAWTQVHQGHLPLWTGYEALGMPLAFNFGSGVFSLPALVSYLTPLRFVYWVQISVSLVVGGTGAYFFGRVLRLHPVACAFAATTCVLSGPWMAYIGLPDTSVMSWAGWQFAAVLLILRGRHRLWSIVLFAVSLAFSIYAGNPQIEVLILLPLAVFIVVVLLCRTGALHGSGQIRRPVVDLMVAGIVGAGLSAPVALPALQLAGASIRSTVGSNQPAQRISQVLGLVFPKFWDQSHALAGYIFNTPESWVWVGAIAVVLAGVAIAIRWRRPEVIGLVAAAAVAAAASLLHPVVSFLSELPLIGQTWWGRSFIALAFCMSILAGIGLDAVLRSSERRRAARLALGAFGVIAGVLALVWLSAARVRTDSFVWPVASTAVGLVAFGTLVVIDRRSVWCSTDGRRSFWPALGVAGSLLLCQTAFLVAVDAPLPSSTSTPYPRTHRVVALRRAVGSSLVGLGEFSEYIGGFGLGLIPNTNVADGIHEFAEYDPITPSTWFSRWKPTNGTPVGVSAPFYDFAPDIGSATVARRYGISYVLEPLGAAGPSGSVFDTRVGDEELYRIPGAATATIVPESSPAAWPSTDAPGKAVRVQWPGPSEVRVVTDASSAQVLRLRVASVPGWHATIDGRPLAVTPYLSMMFQAHIPPGKHIIELRYWPDRFTGGLLIAAGTVILLVLAAFIVWRRPEASERRSPRPPSAPERHLEPEI